ncbi:hypothetical protein [Agaribacter marinus]|uniref:hypothetical protein n=1 Tax=Agaribacter marinus TaxID=1431249 RepID=UPI0024E050B8|nr:hypothetical protein [Agaribacter marinus]
MPVGRGVITYHNGTVRKGLYVNGHLQGEVSTDYAGKASTIGQFVDGKEHGRFEVTMTSGKVYEIFYRGGVKVEDISSTDMYTGYVGERNDIGQKHGFGKGTYYGSDIYIGSWENGKPEGYGLYRWNDSNSFSIGEYKDGHREGYSIAFIQGDSKYIGEWKNGRAEGQGIRYYIGGGRPKEWVGCFHTGRFWRGIAKGELDCSKKDDKAFWDNLKNTKPDLSELERLYPDYDWTNELK